MRIYDTVEGKRVYRYRCPECGYRGANTGEAKFCMKFVPASALKKRDDLMTDACFSNWLVGTILGSNSGDVTVTAVSPKTRSLRIHLLGTTYLLRYEEIP
jgi:hypothetical protein